MVVQSLVANDSQFLKLTVRYLQACSTEVVGIDLQRRESDIASSLLLHLLDACIVLSPGITKLFMKSLDRISIALSFLGNLWPLNSEVPVVKKSNIKFNYKLQVLDQQPEIQLLMANKSILVDNPALIMYMSDEVYLFASYIGRKLQKISEET